MTAETNSGVWPFLNQQGALKRSDFSRSRYGLFISPRCGIVTLRATHAVYIWPFVLSKQVGLDVWIRQRLALVAPPSNIGMDSVGSHNSARCWLEPMNACASVHDCADVRSEHSMKFPMHLTAQEARDVLHESPGWMQRTCHYQQKRCVSNQACFSSLSWPLEKQRRVRRAPLPATAPGRRSR
jgi:hypothetical protein